MAAKKKITLITVCSVVYNNKLDMGSLIDLLIENIEEFSYLSLQTKKEARHKLQTLASLKSLSVRIEKLLNEFQKQPQ